MSYFRRYWPVLAGALTGVVPVAVADLVVPAVAPPILQIGLWLFGSVIFGVELWLLREMFRNPLGGARK